MTLVSRDQMPPRTPYEAELRERVERAEWQTETFRRLAAAQDHVVAAARQLVELMQPDWCPVSSARLADALAALDRETGRILLETMPPELRAALTAQSTLETAVTEPLFPGLTYGAPRGPRLGRITIVAIESRADGESRWPFDYADGFDEAYEKLRRWNDRAAREWPGMRFTLEADR